ncbi:hypothetical protein [Streptomyces hiroshimensis]|uniref:Immunity protein 35 domain-containing protein n=1 Tax=Streptomyces hiroshimensis TaxID=66424 RepID=A0ABQ2Y5K0_9ACTN|nr:hypothetical protein [Streptomyces hiroshimensis]GGX67081.1 hypothetical protein GCM10010324_10410 [Streptomyces hiroshimensis]
MDTTLAHLLGKSQQIVVPGAEHAKDDQATPEAVAAAAAQERLRQWAETELLPLRMQACERKAVLLGDGVYLLAWGPEKGRVRLPTIDPGFYFPVLEDDPDPGDYPTRIHLAWELPEDPKRGIKARLRRRPAPPPGSMCGSGWSRTCPTPRPILGVRPHLWAVG